MDRSLITKYEQGGGEVAAVIHGLGAEQLLAFPVPGTWSMQQVILHIADSELVFADRIKRIIAEDSPTLLAFDEQKWAANLNYNGQSAQDAAELVQLTRRQLSRVLKGLPDEAFARQGKHSEAGLMTLAQVIEKAVWHLEHHLNFAKEKRAKLIK